MRHILKLHRDLDTHSLPQAEHDYTIESFDPVLHKQQWLDLNNLIFSHHPDQGNWVMQDLENRMNEPWFDAQGFFLATENGAIEGFVALDEERQIQGASGALSGYPAGITVAN